MARPIFTHEMIDPDFSWLLNTFKENHPEYYSVELGGLPIILFKVTDDEVLRYSSTPLLPEPITVAPGETPGQQSGKDKEPETL